MNSASRILIITIIIAIALAGGCASRQKQTKPSADQDPASKAPVAAADTSQGNPDVQEKPGQAPIPPPGPRSQPPALTDKLSGGGMDLREKAEVTESAQEFARKNFPGAKHIKVCFSKLYDGWYMLLFTQKGKKIVMSHWNWNSKTKEWELALGDKNFTAEQLEFELKGDVAGEKCFLLK